MPIEYYRAYRPRAVLAIPVAGPNGLAQMLDAVQPPLEVRQLVDLNTTQEPYNVTLADAGIAPDDAPSVVLVDLESVQVDAGLNELPRATCAAAVGRDARALVAGVGSFGASSVVHVLERYLRPPLAAKIILEVEYCGGLGLPPYDRSDDEWPDENLVLFDGLVTDVVPQVGSRDARFFINLTHFLAVLTHSSALTSQVAPGTGYPLAFNVSAVPALRSGGPAGVTALGAGIAAVAGGKGLQTDFWGYYAGSGGYGVKGLLDVLAGLDAFNWAALQGAAQLGAANCVGGINQGPNDAARAALDRIEPLRYKQGAWDKIEKAVRNGQEAIGDAVLRADIIERDKAAYYGAGFRYGVPIAFYKDQIPAGAWGIGTGFAASLLQLPFEVATQGSFWDILVGQCGPEFQTALAPNATSAVVMPFQPILPVSWRSIYAYEIEDWNAQIGDPAPVRGVALVSRTRSRTGRFLDGVDLTAPGAAAAFQQADAVFDSCVKGAFIFRDTPTWMAGVQGAPAVFAPGTLNRPRAITTVPWTTAPLARLAVTDTVLLSTGAAAAGGLGVAAAAQAAGINLDAATAPTEDLRTVAYRYARALYQQARLQSRSLSVKGKLRVDIAPGSTVTVDLPGDKFVREALGSNRDSVVTGLVLRMTILIDSAAPSASTSFQIGFVRTEGETSPLAGNPLYAAKHPYWATACLGLPWCDSLSVRAKVGDRSDLEGANQLVGGVQLPTQTGDGELVGDR